MTQVVQSIKCPNCGAPLELEPGEIIITCGFCASDINTATGVKYIFQHSIIPARYTTPETILPYARSWMGKGFLKPPDLAKKSRIMESTLELLPFFVFHVKASTEYIGYLTRTGTNEERKGTFEKEYFWKIMARRGAEFPTAEYSVPLESKVPFNLSQVPPGAKFLSAEMEEDEARKVLRQELDAHARHLLSDIVDTFTKTETKIEVEEMEFLHAPVWIIKYQYGDRVYRLVMDGASGKDIWAEIPSPGEKKGFFKKMFGGA
ncbi:MAG: hypothetical protein KAT70_06205 [Thermoplasmata archaeon]|nr:hypothetical protein [Thermoplasmata archaeon]